MYINLGQYSNKYIENKLTAPTDRSRKSIFHRRKEIEG